MNQGSADGRDQATKLADSGFPEWVQAIPDEQIRQMVEGLLFLSEEQRSVLASTIASFVSANGPPRQ